MTNQAKKVERAQKKTPAERAAFLFAGEYKVVRRRLIDPCIICDKSILLNAPTYRRNCVFGHAECVKQNLPRHEKAEKNGKSEFPFPPLHPDLIARFDAQEKQIAMLQATIDQYFDKAFKAWGIE